MVEVLNKIGKDYFDEEDITIMEILANQAAIAIENARLVEEKTNSEKLAAIGETIAGTAHYIKNILAGLQGGVNVMDIALKEKNWAFLQKSWPIYKRSSNKISQLVNNMLTYSRDQVLIKSRESMVDVIEACSVTGRGTTFLIHLPTSQVPAETV